MSYAKLSLWALLVACGAAFALPACDDKSEDDKKEEGDDDDKKKKKKSNKDDGDKDDGKTEQAKEQPPLEVPGIAGFVLPPGGVYKHNRLELGDKVMEFDNYTYATSTFPRDKLRADFKRLLEAAGWSVTVDGAQANASKGGTTVEVMFGENEPSETKINIMGTR